MRGVIKFFMVFVFMISLSLQASADGYIPRIIGGEAAANGEFPFTVSLMRDTNAVYSAKCGGTAISSRWILTAAHCVESYTTPESVSALRIMSGSNTMDYNKMTRVERIIIHSNYGDTATFNNDIALLYLAEAITAAPVDSLSTAAVPGYADGTTATVVGWGDTNPSGSITTYPDTLYKVDVPVVDFVTCQATYGASLTANMICAGFQAGGKDACQGDSGGPLFVQNNDNTETLIGIVSFGNGCAEPDNYGVYTKVENYEGWIADNIGGDYSQSTVVNAGTPYNLVLQTAAATASNYDVDTTVYDEFNDSFSDNDTAVPTRVYAIGGTIESMNISNSASTLGLYKTYAKLEFTIDTGQDDDIAVVLQYHNEDADRYTLFICPVLLGEISTLSCDEIENARYTASDDRIMFYVENNGGYDENQTPFGIGDDKVRSTVFLARSAEDEISDFFGGGGGGCSASGSGSVFSFALMIGFCGAYVLRRRFVKNR